MTEDKQDSISCGTAATGGAIKIYFDFSKESEDEITKKIDFAVEMAEKVKIAKARFGGK